MELTAKNILLVSPEPWNHVFVSKHHYAIHLAQKGNQVFFLDPPGPRDLLTKTAYDNLYELAYRGFIRGLRFFPRQIRKAMIRRQFEFLQRRTAIRFDVVWSFDNSVFFDFSALPANVLKISHVVDLNQDFQTGSAAATADICFCTTDLIREKLLKYNPRVFKISHGFNEGQISPSLRPELPGQAKVRAIYSGNLAMPYIDWVTILKTVRNNPDIDFIFVGPNHNVFRGRENQDEAKRNVLSLVNAYHIGRVPASELLYYYDKADILFIAYQERFHREQANPHKMMEYLGSGRMVVATYTAEFSLMSEKGMILMSTRNENFPKLFREAADGLEFWNSVQRTEFRRNWALDNTYTKQIEKIEALIKRQL